MKALRIAETLPEVTPTLLWGNTITQHMKILATAIAPSRSPKRGGKREPPNKLMKTKDSARKDVKNEGTSQ